MRVVGALAMLLVAVSARAEPIEEGLAWLRAQQGPNGELGASRGEEGIVATSEAIATWKALGLAAQPETLAALSALNASPRRADTELLLRRNLALQGTQWAFSVTSFSGHAEGFDFPGNWLMAWSLLAGGPDADWVTRATALASRIDAQGCLAWADNSPSSEVMAMAVLSLRRRTDVLGLDAARSSLIGCLVSQQRPGGDFGSASATALALLAFQSVSLDLSAAQMAARAALLSMQAADGSWGTVRATALALRALGGASPDWEARSEFGRAIVSLSAGTVLQGAVAMARAQFRNAAGVSAPPALVRFSLKQGGVVVTSQEVWLPALTPGQLAEVSASLSTAGLAGQYQVEAEANPQRVLPELDVTNNRATGTLSVLQQVDLALAQGSMQFVADTATTVRARVSVQNLGSTLPASATVSLWAFAARTGRALGSFSVPAGTAQGATVTGEVVFSTADLSGFTAIHALADPDGLLAEYDETNNAAFRFFEAGQQALVDIGVTSIFSTSPAVPVTGSRFVLTGQVRNFSNNLAQRVGLAFIENASGQVIGRTEIPEIQGQQVGTYEVELAVSGKGELTLVVDPDRMLNETALANNTGTLNFATMEPTANFVMQSAAFATDRQSLTAQVQSQGLAGVVGVRVMELLSRAVVARTTVSLPGAGARSLTFNGLDVSDNQKVYEVCIDSDEEFAEAVETDNCAEAAVSAERSNLLMISRNLRFSPWGAAVGERVTLTATARNDAALPFSFSIEFFQGRPGFPEGKFLGRSARVTAPGGGVAEASLEWIREDGPAEVYARIAAVNGRVDSARRLVAGRHLFLEDIVDLGLTTATNNGATAVRIGRVTGQQAPDLVVSYFVFGQASGVALVADSPSGRQVAWRRDLGMQVVDHALMDIEGDGSVEIVVLHNDFLGKSALTVLDASGATRWTQVIESTSGYGSVAAMAIGDVDADGRADIAYYSFNGLTVRRGDTGAELFTTMVFSDPTSAGGSLFVADLDADGHNEVVGVQRGTPFAVRHTGAIWWVGQRVGSDVFALVDLELDGEPELVFSVYRADLRAVSSQTGLPKFFGPFVEGSPPGLAVGPVRQNGLPYTLTASNALDTRVSLHDPALAFVWKRQYSSPRTFDISLADLEGRGRPQAIYVHTRGGPMVLDARNGRTILPMLGGEGGAYRTFHTSGTASEAEPVAIADVRGAGTSSNLVLTYAESSGTADTNQLPSLANYYDGNLLIFGSPHWKRQPTAWPTSRFVKGRIGEDLKLSTDYQWWKTHNTYNQQFFDTPATLLADVKATLSPLGPVPGDQTVALTATVSNIGGLPATQVPVAFYDGHPADGGVVIGRTTVAGPLAPNGGAAPASVAWRAFPEGRHQVCVVVNEDGSIEEPDGEDNTSCREVLVGAPGPGCDVAVVPPSLGVQPVGARPGEALTLTATVQNVGAAGCDATSLVLDDGPPTNQFRVGALSVPPLAPGASHSVAFIFLATAGARQWRVTSDETHALYDVNRSNDVATLDGFYSDAALPDLLVESVLVTTAQPAYPGEVVRLAARVRNLGAPSPETTLRLSGGQRVSVPPLAAGEAIEVTLEALATAATVLAAVTVDTEQLVAELDEGNNSREVLLRVTPAPLAVSVLATPSSVGPNSLVGVSVQATPANGAEAAVSLSVDVVDAAGRVVASLLAAAPRVLATTGLVESLGWNTGTNPPGAYAIQVRAEAGGGLVGAASAAVQVLAGSPSLTASLQANRGTVPAGGDVVLSFAARNTSGNLALTQLTGTLSVFDPASQLVFRELRHVSALAAGGLASGAAVVSIGRSAQPGPYTATLEFADGTTLLAQAGASFTVQVDPTFTVEASLSAPASFQVGAMLPAEVHLENLGAVALSNQSLTVEMLNAEAGLAVESLGTAVVSLDAGASQAHAFLLPTAGVPVGQKLLVARLEGRVVDTRPISALPLTDVDPPRIDITGIGDGDFANQAVRPVVTVTDANPFTAVATLDAAPFADGDVITSEGPHVLTVEAQDLFGNRAWVTVRFTIDLTPPALLLNGPADGSLHVAAQTLAWSATDDSPVTTTGALDGRSIISGELVAIEGDFEWSVRAEDAAGNVTTETRRFGIDATAPAIALSAPAEGAYTRGPTQLAWTVTDAHPGAVVALLDGVPVSSPASVTTEGQHTLTVTATDAAGNVAAASRRFTLDDTPPSLAVTGVVDGAVTRGPVVPGFVVADASPVTVTSSLDASPFTPGGVVATEGGHELAATARDAAGNETSLTVRFVIDDTPPAITIFGVTDGALLNTSVSPSFTVQDANPGSVMATLDGAPFSSGTAVTSEGVHELSVTALDAAGNASSRAVRFELDFTAPIIIITGVTDGATGPSFAPLVSVTGAASTSTTLDGAPFVSGTLVTSAGPHVLLVSATDAVGNTATRTVTFEVVPTGGRCVDLQLMAERRYAPHGWTDARYVFSAPLRVAIPWSLDVTAGNAGNKHAYLFLGLGGQTTRCQYRGGSPLAHPTRAVDVAAGRSYVLERCTHGATAGALVTVDEVRLHVHEGDSKAGTTSALWRLQESPPCVGAQPSDAGVPPGRHCGHERVACEDDEVEQLEGALDGSGR